MSKEDKAEIWRMAMRVVQIEETQKKFITENRHVLLKGFEPYLPTFHNQVHPLLRTRMQQVTRSRHH